MRRPTLQVAVECNNACVFCAQRGTTRVVAALPYLHESLKALRSTSDEVTFVGGEPTLAPSLRELVAAAAALGFKGIGLQTNGRVLADRAAFVPLVEAGLTDLHLSIHGAEAAVHDYHTGVPGSFGDIRRTLANARSLRVPVVATTVLSRSNYRVLAPMPPFLAGNGVAGWLLLVPRVAGALAIEDRITPRLTLAVQGVRQAVEIARRAQLPVWIEGAPACLLGPMQINALTDQPARAYAEVCAACPSRERCPGVDSIYLARFKADELVARASPTERVESPVTRQFVGIGELVQPAVVPSSEPTPPQAEAAAAGLVALSVSKAG